MKGLQDPNFPPVEPKGEPSKGNPLAIDPRWQAMLAAQAKKQEEIRLKRAKVAEAFLVAHLAGSAKFVKAIKQEAKRKGVSWAGVRVARHILDVESTPTPDGQVWSLKPM